MSTLYSKRSVAYALASALVLTACSDTETEKKNTTLTASAPITSEASNLTERNAQQRLKQTLEINLKQSGIEAKILEIKATEIPQLYWVALEGLNSVYATTDGKYVIDGDLYRLGNGSPHNISEEFKAIEHKKYLAQLKTEDLIIYKAKGKPRHVVYVFTDVSCPYCHKLHEHLPEMNAKGIEVRYIAWPRGEQLMPAMEAIWCSKDRHAAFDAAIKQSNEPAASDVVVPQCKNPVKEHYELGLKMGVNGTPAIYSQDGLHLGAYMTADELIQKLNK